MCVCVYVCMCVYILIYYQGHALDSTIVFNCKGMRRPYA